MNEKVTILQEDLVTKSAEQPQEKLFVLQDVEGNEPLEKMKKINELSQRLRERDPRVVGLTITGSTVQGYSLADSDIDINIILDTSNSVNTDPPLDHKKLSDLFEGDVKTFSEQSGASFELLECKDIGSINEENLFEDPAAEVGILIYPFFGDESKKQNLVLKVKKALKKLDNSKVEVWINDFATGMVGGDLPEKRFKRFGILQTVSNRNEYIEQRRNLYKQKIRELFID